MVREKRALLLAFFLVAAIMPGCGKKLQEQPENNPVTESTADGFDSESIQEDTTTPEVVLKEDQEGSPRPTEEPAPAVPLVTEADLIITTDPQMYTYVDMKQDLKVLLQLYPEYLTIDTLGQTLDKREIYHLVIGNPQGETRVFINGSIHGREYMTSQLVMKQTAAFLKHISSGDSYGDQTYASLMENTVIHVVPMINPDGVTISQFGFEGIQSEHVKERVRSIASLDGEEAEGYYLTRWKANANGVDINRNFDALWEDYAGAGHPSSDHYKGESIGCEPESAALIALTQQEMFDRTISYHTQGSVIYWYFGQEGEPYEETLDFADCISKVTGYPTDANYEYLDPAGYKDWGIDKLGIPGLTVEIGTETSPVPASQFAGIWERNQYVWEETILNVGTFLKQ